MRKITGRSARIRNYHPTFDQQLYLIIDTKRRFCIFHSHPQKKVTRQGAHLRTSPKEAWRVLFKSVNKIKLTLKTQFVIFFFILSINPNQYHVFFKPPVLTDQTQPWQIPQPSTDQIDIILVYQGLPQHRTQIAGV